MQLQIFHDEASASVSIFHSGAGRQGKTLTGLPPTVASRFRVLYLSCFTSEFKLSVRLTVLKQCCWGVYATSAERQGAGVALVSWEPVDG